MYRLRAGDGKLPPILFVQAEGGPENINQSMLAFCELLVAQRLFQSVFF